MRLRTYYQRQIIASPAQKVDKTSINPENVLLVVNTSDVDAENMRDYYVSKRNIPLENIINYPLTWVPADGYDMDNGDQEAILALICDKLDTYPHITTICPVGAFPIRPSSEFVSEVGSSANQMSIVHVLAKPFLARDKGEVGLYAIPSLASPNIHGIIPKNLIDASHYPGISGVTEELENPAIATDPWIADKVYNVGDTVYTTTSLHYWYILTCTVGGTSGSTEPTSFLSTIIDNTVEWFGARVKYPRIVPPNFKLPRDHYSIQKSIGDNLNGSWKDRLTYMVTFLDVPYVGANDPTNTSRLELFQKMIDNGLEVENSYLTEIPGNIVLSGTNTTNSDVAAAAYLEMQGKPFKSNLYYEVLSAEDDDFPNFDVPAGSNRPATATILSPSDTGTFVPIDNVFFHAVGSYSYFGGKPPIQPTDITYAKGAITLFGQSCGAYPPPPMSFDTLFDPFDIESAINGGGSELDVFGVYRHIGIRNPDGSVQTGFPISYTGAGTTATLAVPSDNQIVLRVDGAVVATINLTTDSWLAHRAAILAALPVDWVTGEGCAYYESRVARALRNGASVAIGIPVEPGSNSNPSTTNMIEGFYTGASLGHIMMTHAPYSVRIGGAQDDSFPIFYGDPMYTPLRGYRS